MKKIFIMSLFSITLFSFISVKATNLSQYLPGGKNYLDYENVLVYSNEFELNDSIKVKSDNDYTLSIPGTNMFSLPVSINIYGTESYINGDISSNSSCSIEASKIYCNFHTNISEERIWIEIATSNLTQYYDYYGIEYFQLEEGLLSTTYEEYIAPLIDTEDPLLSGTGLFVNSYQTPIALNTIIDTHITAYDEVDGDLTDNIIIDYDEYTGNENIVGEYIVLLSVIDSSSNEATFELIIKIKDEIVPTITGPSEINQHFLIEETLINIINNNFVLFDEVDNNLDIEIVTDEYSLNIGRVGTYNVLFKAIDNSLNYIEQSFIISVYDNTAPTLISSQTYNSYLSSVLSIENIIESLVYNDDYDNVDAVTLNILTDGYSTNENSVGTYFVNIELIDTSLNIKNETITINVIDDIAPSITGPDSLTISYESNLSIEEIKNMMSVTDNYDDIDIDDLQVISDLFSERDLSLGTFNIVFEVSDNTNNLTSHTLSITVIDDISPIIYVDSYIVTINLGSSFNENDAIELLKANYEIDDDNYTITTLVNEYEGNELIRGSYIYKIRLTSSSGEIIDKEFVVKVVDLNDNFNVFNNLSYRNISIYTFSIVFLIFVGIKKRK